MTTVAAAVVFSFLAAAAVPRVLDIVRSQRVTPADRPPPGSIVGAYGTTVTGAADDRLVGDWRISLQADGIIVVQAFPDGALSSSRLSYQYQLAGDRFETDLFSNDFCSGVATGAYRWEPIGSAIVFTVIDDTCDERVRVFTASPWSSA